MCMEDIRLGRHAGAAPRSVQLPAGGAPTQIVPADPTRTHLAIYSSDGVFCNIAPTGLTPSATVGARLGYIGTPVTDPTNIPTAPLEFDIQKHGLLVTFGFSGSAPGAAANLMVIETFIHKD